MPIIVVRHWPDLRAENPDEHAKATDAQAGRSNESTTGADDAATSWNELTESWDAASDSPHATAARSDEAVGRSDEGAESADESAGSADDWLSVKPDGRNLWTRLRILRTPERGGGRPCGFERTGRRELRILRTCRCQRRPGRACGKCGFGVRKSPDYAEMTLKEIRNYLGSIRLINDGRDNRIWQEVTVRQHNIACRLGFPDLYRELPDWGPR